MIRLTVNTFPGFDPVFGARPHQREITSRLAEAVLSGFFADHSTVRIDLADDASGLTFETVAEADEVEA